MSGGRPFALLAGMMIAAACGGGDYEIPLPGGYIVARISADRFVVVAPNRRDVVLPSIDEYQVYGRVVVGHIPKATRNADAYFILDTVRGQVRVIEDEATWRRQLVEIGIHEASLVRPARWRAWLRQ